MKLFNEIIILIGRGDFMISKNDENYIYYLVGQNLKKYRKMAKLTQEELSIKSNYHKQFISNLESPKTHQTVSLGTLYAFAKVLNISVSKLLEEDNEEE